ncbi:MAG: hypothetical protein NZL83_04285 [Candidatus Absconditabacterales bacterium]|nr:hypothetical protein [Candidatus Absconditabacterales bacterium]
MSQQPEQQRQLTGIQAETQTGSFEFEVWKTYLSGSTQIDYTTKDENVSLGYFGTVEIDINGETIPYERYVYITKTPGANHAAHGAIALFDSRYTEVMTQYFSSIDTRPFKISGDDGLGKSWIIFPDPNKKVTIKYIALSAGDASFEK